MRTDPHFCVSERGKPCTCPAPETPIIAEAIAKAVSAAYARGHRDCRHQAIEALRFEGLLGESGDRVLMNLPLTEDRLRLSVIWREKK